MTHPRYVSRIAVRAVHCEDDVWPMPRETIDVVVVEDDPVHTGLVDHLGVPIMRLSSKAPIGFCR